MIFGFKNANCVFADGVRKTDIQWSDGRIASFSKRDDMPSLKEGVFLCPGFIDEHIHGANGSDVMDGSIASLENISASLAQEGVTSFLATTMTESIPSIEKALENVKEYRKGAHQGARIEGVHLEGPFISPTFKGAQSLEYIREPSREELDHFNHLSGEAIREVTFAYERDKNDAFLSYCLTHHIVPSLGHSDCPGSLAVEGFQKGIRSVTHLFNAQRRIHHRDVGVAGAALLMDDVKVELIADLHHSCAEAVSLVFKTKKKQDIILISDSTEAKYLPEGTSAKLGSQPIWVKGGVAVLKDGTIAGSILRLDQALRNVRPLAKDYSYADLINLATINPAKNIGLEQEIGSLAVGHRADFVLLDKDFHVLSTIINGEIVYGSLDSVIEKE